MSVQGRVTDQEAVEELVSKKSQHTDDGVAQMVEEEHVHHHGLVPPGERALVPHEAHQEHHLVEQLKDRWTPE